VNFDLVSNITSELVWNYTNKGTQDFQKINSTHIQNIKIVEMPLLQSNNTQVSFHFLNHIVYINGSTEEVESEVKNQTIIYAYWIDSLTTDRENYVEFEDCEVKVWVKDKIGKANLTINITFIYNSSFEVEREIETFNQFSDLKVFNSSFDTLESFQTNESRTITTKLKVVFRGNERLMTMNKTLEVYRIILTDCSSLSQTESLILSLKDEESDSKLNGTIEATFDVWKTGEIKRNYAWKFENVYNASICIYPSWATYTIDAMLQYYANDYPDRTYYIYTEISNQTKQVDLYLLPSNLADTVVIYIVDENGNKVENAIVKIQRYYVGSNAYKTVAQVKTDYEGKGVTFLRVNEIYYRFIIERNFTVLRETEPTIIICQQSVCPPYPITLGISESKPAEYFQYLGKIAYSCSVNEETNILRCTVDDTSQLMQKARLIVDRKGALRFEPICDSEDSSSAITFTCDLGNRTNQVYRYKLIAYFPKTYQILAQEILDYTTSLIAWGSQGLLLSFLLITTLFFVGIFSPVASIVFAFLGIIAGYLLGLLPISISSLIGLGIAIAILLWKLRV